MNCDACADAAKTIPKTIPVLVMIKEGTEARIVDGVKKYFCKTCAVIFDRDNVPPPEAA